MKVLQIVSGKNVNGAVIYCKLLAEALADRGHDVTLLARTDCFLRDQMDSSPVKYLESNLNRFPPGELRKFASKISSENFDLIHTHMSRANTFGILLRMMTGIPVVATAHANHFHPHWRICSSIIANSMATYRYQSKVNRIPEQKLSMVYCFTNLERANEVTPRDMRIVRRQLRLKGDEFVVGVVGEVVKRKGHIHFFKALAEIVKKVPNLKIVLLGRFRRDEVYTRQLRTILIQQGLFQRTKWLGLRDNVQDYMAIFDMCVVPSLVEPLGLVAIESLAAGTPVVASSVGGLAEVVDHEETGLLVPPANSRAIAEAVIRMATDADFRAACGETGRKRMFERFDPAHLTDQIESVYRQVVQQRAVA